MPRAKLSSASPQPWTTEVLSSAPRAYLLHNFLSKEECEHLIALAKPHLTRSRVVDEKTGGGKESSSRTSSGMFLRRGQDKVVRTIEKRIADHTKIPVVNGEALQILHYGVGQKFNTHFDYIDGTITTTNGGPRQATLVMYLSDVEDGGETVFPDATTNSTSSSSSLVKPAEGISVKPKMGDALLFWSMRPDGSRDPRSLHGANPVLKGEKWSATKWMHVHQYK